MLDTTRTDRTPRTVRLTVDHTKPQALPIAFDADTRRQLPIEPNKLARGRAFMLGGFPADQTLTVEFEVCSTDGKTPVLGGKVVAETNAAGQIGLRLPDAL